MDARNDSVVSMKPTEKIVVNISDSIITKAEENFRTAPVDSISALSPETIDRNEDMTSSSETKGTFIFILQYKHASDIFTHLFCKYNIFSLSFKPLMIGAALMIRFAFQIFIKEKSLYQ